MGLAQGVGIINTVRVTCTGSYGARYAQRMADRIDAELEFAKRVGKGHEASVLELGVIAKGWRFTAIAVA